MCISVYFVGFVDITQSKLLALQIIANFSFHNWLMWGFPAFWHANLHAIDISNMISLSGF